MAERVLLLGENWFGSCARACAYALRRLGCDVTDVDIQTYLPLIRGTWLRAGRRLAQPLLISEYNAEILRLADTTHPDILLAFKGAQVLPDTLTTLRTRGIELYNYYPDTSMFAHGALLSHTLPLYDCVFYTKRHWEIDQLKKLALRASAFVAHGYDPEVHFPKPTDQRDSSAFGHDVVFIATYTPYKESILSGLVSLRPSLDLAIWGHGWQHRAKDPRLRPFVKGCSLHGSSYARALQSAKICLSIMSGPAHGSDHGDLTTTRSFEIPACGAFMLHERNPEIACFYLEDQEVVLFDSPRELAEKIDFYLANTSQRLAIAQNGYRRCVPAYSYDARVKEILSWHRARANSN